MQPDIGRHELTTQPETNLNVDIEDFLCGKQLYGDNLDLPSIIKWFEDEREGYAGLVTSRDKDYKYSYHALNQYLGFRHLPARKFSHALGVGSAFGDEFYPIRDSIKKLTILEPSKQFEQPQVHGIPVKFVSPTPSGVMPFADNEFDLMTCFGVLHHIPNVSFVLKEFHRCLQVDGHCLIREPIVSMGDWRTPRPRLTKHERGIPRDLMLRMAGDAGFVIERCSYCVFPPLIKLWGKLHLGGTFERKLPTVLDSLLCRLFSFNSNYHATRTIQKFRPASAFLVLRKT